MCSKIVDSTKNIKTLKQCMDFSRIPKGKQNNISCGRGLDKLVTGSKRKINQKDTKKMVSDD